LLDLVADARASTPSHAASLVVPDVDEERRRIVAARDRARVALRTRLDHETRGLADMASRRRRAGPLQLLAARSEELILWRDRARRTIRNRIDRAADDVRSQIVRARALSPLATLQRGYAVLHAADGRAVGSVEGVRAGESVLVRLVDGRIRATTTGVEPDPIAPAVRADV
jgi:exodeoxyribonuclease VII large subunit